MSGSTMAAALRQLRNRFPDADQFSGYPADAPPEIVQVCRVVVTAVDSGSTPQRHTLSGVDDEGTPNASVVMTGAITPDGLALPLGTQAQGVQFSDGQWMLLTGVTRGATTMPAHSHTGGDDGPIIGIVS